MTLAVAFAVLGRQGSLPTPDALDSVVGTDALLYGLLLLATLLLGLASRPRSGAAS